MGSEPRITFVKAESNGNDFLIVDAAACPPAARPELARQLCDRHRGIGADGVEFVAPRGGGFELHLHNADGSVAEISGNGTRCVAAFYARNGFRQGVLLTGAGPRTARVLDGAGAHWTIEIEIGVPEAAAVPPGLPAANVTVLSVGNPQCIVFVPEFPADWERIGAGLEGHPAFPHRTNVEFVRVLDRHHVEIRIFERGVGPTQSSGTGSTAAAVAAIARGLCDSPVEVQAPGGAQRVAWSGPGRPAHLTGSAALVAEGVFFRR